jgi:AcrR family transcriptional regulator
MRMVSLRDKSAQLRRDHIVQAAISVFAAKGYHRATIRDIALVAGVADGTIYSSFANKAALLMAVLDPLDEASRPMPAMEPGTEIKVFLASAMARRFAALTPDKLDVLRVVLSEALVNEELRALYVERVLTPALTLPLQQMEGLATGRSVAMPDPALLMRVMVGAVTGLVMLRLLGDTLTETQWTALGETLAEVMLSSLADGPFTTAQSGAIS